MPSTIFYSWQTDIDVKVNKNFIKTALKKAISAINSELKVEDSSRQDELSIDHDTKNTPGSPQIVDTIFMKIDECGIFFADLTYVASVPEKHGVSNPNVLTEKGYALKAVGRDRILAVMNEAYGKAENLPFDFQGQRWPMRYHLLPTDDKLKFKEQEKLLVDQFKIAIKTILDSGLIHKKENTVELLKNLILDPKEIIRVDGIVNDEVSRVCKLLQTESFSLSNTDTTNKAVWDRVKQYEKLLQKLLDMIIIGCYWGEKLFHPLWQEIIRRVGSISIKSTRSFYKLWENLSLFPSLLLLYGAGIAALKNNKYDALSTLFKTNIKAASSYYETPISNLSPAILPLEKLENSFRYPNYGSKYLHQILRAPLATAIPDDRHYDYYFCFFELIYNLVLINYRLEKEDTHHHVFCSLSFQALNSHNKVIDDLAQEVNRLKDSHPLLLAGLFSGKTDNLIKALDTIKEASKSYLAVY